MFMPETNNYGYAKDYKELKNKSIIGGGKFGIIFPIDGKPKRFGFTSIENRDLALSIF